MEEEDFTPDYVGLVDPIFAEPLSPSGPSSEPETLLLCSTPSLPDLQKLEPSTQPETLPPAARKKSLQLCPQLGCESRTNKLKRHVIRYHIANDEWWFLYPLLTCWNCLRWEIAKHIENHGPFELDRLPELAQRLEGFVQHVCSRLELTSVDELVSFVVRRQLGDNISTFSTEEILVWDAYDKFIGLPPLDKRNVQFPTRLSSVLHWRTLQRLLVLVAAPTVVSSPTTDFIDAHDHIHVDGLLNKSQYKESSQTTEQQLMQEPKVSAFGEVRLV